MARQHRQRLPSFVQPRGTRTAQFSHSSFRYLTRYASPRYYPEAKINDRHGTDRFLHTPANGSGRMTDIVDRNRRSELMARIRGQDTAPELSVRRIAHRMGLRFRLHRKDLPGRPDLVFPKHRLVVFVHGCFWHRHEGCQHASTPKSRNAFWTKKFASNVDRDARQQAALRKLGWQVLVIWECEVKDAAAVERRLGTSVGKRVQSW